MENITTVDELKQRIIFLKVKREEDGRLLKKQFNLTYESLKPGNLIKNTIKDIIHGPDVKDGLVNTGIGLAAGFLSKKVLVGSTLNPIKSLIGSLLQIGVTKVVSTNGDGIRSGIGNLIAKLFGKKETAV